MSSFPNGCNIKKITYTLISFSKFNCCSIDLLQTMLCSWNQRRSVKTVSWRLPDRIFLRFPSSYPSSFVQTKENVQVRSKLLQRFAYLRPLIAKAASTTTEAKASKIIKTTVCTTSTVNLGVYLLADKLFPHSVAAVERTAWPYV